MAIEGRRGSTTTGAEERAPRQRGAEPYGAVCSSGHDDTTSCRGGLVSPKSSLSRDDWADAALEVLLSGGLGAVAVEPIARALGVTKGSFYWHFQSRDDLVEAALLRWEEVTTNALASGLETIPDPRERLFALFQRAFETRRIGFLLVHLSANASDARVAPVLERVTRKRLDLIRAAFIACGMASTEAEQRALLCYTAYVGMFSVRSSDRDIDWDRDAYLRHVVDTLFPRATS